MHAQQTAGTRVIIVGARSSAENPRLQEKPSWFVADAILSSIGMPEAIGFFNDGNVGATAVAEVACLKW